MTEIPPEVVTRITELMVSSKTGQLTMDFKQGHIIGLRVTESTRIPSARRGPHRPPNIQA